MKENFKFGTLNYEDEDWSRDFSADSVAVDPDPDSEAVNYTAIYGFCKSAHCPQSPPSYFFIYLTSWVWVPDFKIHSSKYLVDKKTVIQNR